MQEEYRTKHYIASEFKKMVTRKPIRKISVNDIAQQCRMSRGTFYYHFKDKQDLINWIYRVEVIIPVRKVLKHSLEIGGAGETAEANALFYTLLYQEKDFYCQAIRLTGQNCLIDTILEEARINIHLIKTAHVRESCNGRQHDQSEDMGDFLNEHFALSNANSAIRWIQEGMQRSPEMMAEYTHIASRYGIRAMRHDKEQMT